MTMIKNLAAVSALMLGLASNADASSIHHFTSTDCKNDGTNKPMHLLLSTDNGGASLTLENKQTVYSGNYVTPDRIDVYVILQEDFRLIIYGTGIGKMWKSEDQVYWFHCKPYKHFTQRF